VSRSPEGDSPLLETSARYKFTVSYDGTNFWGFQRQTGVRTIQAEIESALKRLGWEETTIIGAGRTDTGVHAEGQVFSADLRWAHGCEKLKAALNAELPEDIAILNVEPAADSFHPRYDAQSRVYRYRIYQSAVREPLKERYKWRIWPAMDLERLKTTAKVLVGEHDFRAFGSPPRKNGATKRQVMNADWFPGPENEIYFEVQADGFLYHMVRRMVMLQHMVDCGWLSWDDWERAVLRGEAAKPGIAPAKGLSLVKVNYAETVK